MEQLKGNKFEAEGVAERHSLYPERVTDSYQKTIDEIARLESGEIPKQELNEFEKQKLLEFEEAFALRFESLYKQKEATAELYPKYFETSEGRESWRDLFGEDLPELFGEELERFLYTKARDIANIETSARKKFAAESRAYADKELLDSLVATMGERGELFLEGIESPRRINLVLNPDELEAKIFGLRELKSDIKQALANIEDDGENISSAQKCVLEMYLSRVNESLARQHSPAYKTVEKARAIGVEALSDSERRILEGMSVALDGDLDAHRARIDKFVYGADREYDEEGYRKQVSRRLLDYANEVEIEQRFIDAHKDELVETRGLDPEKIEEKTITAADRKRWGESLLERYGLLSSDTSTDPSQLPLDNKWRYIVGSNKSMSVDQVRKVVHDKEGDSAATHTFPVALAHEIEGHVLQGANKEQVPLRLFQDIGGGRSSVFAEGGAMHNQNVISKKIFGFEQLPKPHYVRAMAERLRGGNFLDCVKAYYESSVKELRSGLEQGEISKEHFQEKARSLLKKNISSTKRLFRSDSLSSDSNYLLSSKDTAYLEQRKVLRGLEEAGLFKLAYVSGVNLENARELIRFGLLDLDKIKEPRFETLEIWSEVKEKYTK